MALYRLSINSEYLGFEGREGKKDSDKERTIVGIYIGKWKLRFFFFKKICCFLIDTTCFKGCVLYLKDTSSSKGRVWCLKAQPIKGCV